MTEEKIAIATVTGTMDYDGEITTIYYNGKNKRLTEETADTVREIEYFPINFIDAVKAVKFLYSIPCWDLQMK